MRQPGVGRPRHRMRPDGFIYREGWLLGLLIAGILVILFVAVMFAALAIAIRILKSRREAREERMKRLWLRPVLDAIMDSRTEPFRHSVRRRDRLLFAEFLGRLALCLTDTERPALHGIAKPYVVELKRLLRDRDAEFRALGIQLLGLLGPNEFRRYILWALEDRTPVVALTAIRALALTNRTSDVRRIIDELHRFDGWGHTLVTSILVSCGSKAIAPLRETFADPARPAWIRVAACDALRLLDDYAAAEVASRVILSRPGRDVSASALRLIQRLGMPGQSSLLWKMAADHDPVVRLHAVSGLAAVGGEEAADMLAISLNDPSNWVAIRAARGLKALRRYDILAAAVAMNHPRAALARQFLHGETAHA